MKNVAPGVREAWLETEALRLGLDAVGIAPLDQLSEPAARLSEFLDLGRHGDMAWLADHAERRRDPLTLWPAARSAILIGHSYAPDSDPLEALGDHQRGVISVYAKGRDYHDVLKARIKQLARGFSEASGEDVKVFVDTAPLMEKPLAALAGIGWQGKHTNLVSRTHGSWLFLGAILTTADLKPSTPAPDHCGSCQRCLDICPTKAFPKPYQLDARRCIAYLTIEHKGHIARSLRRPIGNRVFGCDDCLAVCPWNRFAQASLEQKYACRPATDNPPIDELLALDDAQFRAAFAGTPVKRTGRDRVVRNSLIAAGNAGHASRLALITPLLEDASAIVRAAAVWAVRLLGNADQQEEARRKHLMRERDATVSAEWSGDIDTDVVATDLPSQAQEVQ